MPTDPRQFSKLAREFEAQKGLLRDLTASQKPGFQSVLAPYRVDLAHFICVGMTMKEMHEFLALSEINISYTGLSAWINRNFGQTANRLKSASEVVQRAVDQGNFESPHFVKSGVAERGKRAQLAVSEGEAESKLSPPRPAQNEIPVATKVDPLPEEITVEPTVPAPAPQTLIEASDTDVKRNAEAISTPVESRAKELDTEAAAKRALRDKQVAFLRASAGEYGSVWEKAERRKALNNGN